MFVQADCLIKASSGSVSRCGAQFLVQPMLQQRGIN
ncbi:MAG: hypothetical protein ACJA1Y_001542, partial [Burkholderiaceae bacterium]